MPRNDPLERIVFIDLPHVPDLRVGHFPIDPGIPLPLEMDTDADEVDPEEITWESIIAGMLKVLAYRPGHRDAAYFRRFVCAARPGINEELTEAGIFKARNGDLDLAEELFLALTGLFPENPQPAVNLALTYEERVRSALQADDRDEAGRRHREVLTAYRRALDIDPLFPDAHFNLAFFHSEMADHDSCRRHLELYLKYGKDEEKLQQARSLREEIHAAGLGDALFRKAVTAIRDGREQEGIEHARRFVRDHPETWNGWFVLGWGLRRAGDYAQARVAFEKALQLGEPQVDTLNELSICNLELGDLAGSERCLHLALELAPEDTRVISNLGVLQLRRGDTEGALGYFRTVQEIDPDDPVAARYLAAIAG
ncbi:MAG: tetratricopeptide repeat protein [Spirochaetaceae bacterium]|nr:tetratricopeptide repeat protein [Spirochaetaceae bacterium]